MKTKSIITTIVLGILSLNALAQQDEGYSMYFFNPVAVNPAYAGSREVFSGSLVHRSQWTKMPGAPISQNLSVHSAIPNSNVGLGLQISNDQSGPMKNTGVNLTYAYHMPINENFKLSFGLTGVVNNIRIAWSDINIDDKNDASFAGNKNSSWVPDAKAGLYLYSDKFYAGLSATHLFESKFKLTEAIGADQAKFYRHFFLTSGVVLPVTKTIDFRPSVLVKYVSAAPAVGELNASFIFNKKFLLGAGFRSGKRIDIEGTDNMIVGLLQLYITNSLSIGYAYDYYLNRSKAYNHGTHEFMFSWDVSRNKTKMSSPRFF